MWCVCVCVGGHILVGVYLYTQVQRHTHTLHMCLCIDSNKERSNEMSLGVVYKRTAGYTFPGGKPAAYGEAHWVRSRVFTPQPVRLWGPPEWFWKPVLPHRGLRCLEASADRRACNPVTHREPEAPRGAVSGFPPTESVREYLLF